MANPSSPKPYSIGKAFDISELRVRPSAVRTPSPRDIGLEKAAVEASANAESQVIPFYISATDKIPTVKLAARRIVRRLGLPVNVSSHSAYPSAVLFSRGQLRGKRKTSSSA